MEQGYTANVQSGVSTTRLSGRLLIPARIAWLVITFIALGLFTAGLPPRYEDANDVYRGDIQALLQVNQAGEVILSPYFTGAAMHAGILEGDILLSVNDITVTSLEQAQKLLIGKLGTQIKVKVQTGNFPARQVTVKRGGEYGQLLSQFGLTSGFAVGYVMASDILFALICVAIGLVIFVRRSDDWMALLSSLTFIVLLLGLSVPVGYLRDKMLGTWKIALFDLWLLSGYGLLPVLFYLFPSGQFIPRPTKYLTGIIILWVILSIFFPTLYPWRMTGSKAMLTLLPIFGTGVIALAYRYRYRSDAVQRQQIRWIVWGALAATLGLALQILDEIQYLGSSFLSFFIRDFAIYPFGQLLKLLLPVSVVFAIRRYRLWDIHILLNRALVYGVLTVSVIGMYVLIVGGLGTFLQTQYKLPDIVIAVLLIAFLFQPLHRRLQGIANRFVPVSQTIVNQSILTPVLKTEQVQKVYVTDSAPNTIVHGRWLPIVRWVWAAGFIALALIYVFGLLAVRDALSTVCEEELCTLRQQIRHTEAGEQVMDGGGPPIGYADRLRPDQVKALDKLGLTLDRYGWLGVLQMGIPALAYLLIAAGLFWRKSDDWMVLFMSMMVATLPLVFMPLSYTLLVHRPAWVWVFAPAEFVAVSSFFIFPLIFPTGRFVPRWTRWKIFFDIAFAIIDMLSRSSILREPPGLSDFTYVYILLSICTNVYALSYRYLRLASPLERQQLKWVVAGLAGYISIAALLLLPLNDLLVSRAASMDPARALVLSTIPDTLFLALGLFIPISIAISVMRYRLWDIDILINRTMVYGTLTAGIIGIYVLVVGVLGTTIQERGNLLVSILTTGLIAVMAQPLRDRLQRGVNRLLYGERDDPVTVLSRLGQRLEATLAPDAVLPSLVETVAQTLKLPYVAIETTNTRLDSQPFDSAQDKPETDSASINPSFPIISYGTPQPGLIRLPLIYQSETIGQLIVSPRAQDEKLSPMDRHLLENIAHQAGMAVHAVSLTADLQRSRQNLVTAREEERRRLRRDLHDGLGPNLASQGLKLAAVKQLLENNPSAAIPLLDQVMSQNKSTVDDVRRLVYGLRPPALDELGLVAAIRDHVAGMGGKSTLQIEITEPSDGLPPLSAAVEVAAYRIVLEALTNVIRHAQAKQCAIRFFVSHNGSSDVLRIEIHDDGKGMPEAHRAGVGLRSMRERAEEIGGSCVVESNARQGTCISVKVPLITTQAP